MQRDLRDAGVFDLEMIRLRQRQAEQHRKHHADDAAVAENARRFHPDDFAMISFRHGSMRERNWRLLSPFGTRAQFDFVQPVVGMDAEFVAHLLPVETRPVAKIDFAQRGQNRLRVARRFSKRARASAARVSSGWRKSRRIFCRGEISPAIFACSWPRAERFMSIWPPKIFLIARLDFGVTDQQQRVVGCGRFDFSARTI